ncbi:adenylate kinase [bacterium]|nr:adenylate kinase [bacterium]
MNVVFLGAPGAGKGTQAENVKDHFGLKHISSGDLLRESLKKETDLGLKAKAYMDRGDLVPDEIVFAMIQEKLPAKQGVLFDGFPRNLEQAKQLDQVFSNLEDKIDTVINLDVKEDLVVDRLIARGRKDDNPEVIKNRLDVYRKQTQPLCSYYETQGKLFTIDASESVEQVWDNIKVCLERKHG